MGRLHLRLNMRRMMVVVALAGVVLALAKYLFIDNKPRDVLPAATCSLGGHYTVYAEGYSETRFRSIGIEMTVRQVEEIMGPPLRKGQWQFDDGNGPITPEAGDLDEIWYYARGGKQVQGATASHGRREVLFRKGVVWRTETSYYIG